jgi:membrane-bound ClpP family serine protease
LTLAGLLLIYCELVWMGSVLPGMAGAALTMCGVYWLVQFRPAAAGVQLLAGATACFAAEARYQTWFLMGAMATVMLGFGFWKLYSQPPSIDAGLAFSGSFVFGAVTIVLLDAGKRGRRNKRVDL